MPSQRLSQRPSTSSSFAALWDGGSGVSFLAAGHGAKSALLTKAAASLNIARASLVHFDDNPVEVAEISASAPDITSLRVPADPGATTSGLGPAGSARKYRAAVAHFWAIDEPLPPV
ncbi:hypothetical protein FNF27_03593 [Cafeteria roenbergensis]|uniref:Uncharacterized protein n=1 Tax=Cafeteria roenbergensis TaxID=33653 RepID=A0A5A8EC67_CAFRO|nr:hypothetical protein FNF27_03593 [Cafeteria roenbergensis]